MDEPKAPNTPPTGRFMDIARPKADESANTPAPVSNPVMPAPSADAIQKSETAAESPSGSVAPEPTVPEVDTSAITPEPEKTEPTPNDAVDRVPAPEASTPEQEHPALPAKTKHTAPIAAICVAMAICLGLTGLVIYTYIKSKNDTKTGATTSSNSKLTAEKPQASPDDIDQTSTEIDETLSSIDDAADFSASSLSDEALGLQCLPVCLVCNFSSKIQAMTKILNTLSNSEIVELLNQSGVGVLPTDTVYGLVCRAADQDAVARLYGLKNRENKPGTVIAANTDQLVELGIKARYLKAVEQYWPNPISIIMPNYELSYIHQGKGGIAVRIPKHQELQELLKQTGPLLTSSANQPGEPEAQNIDEARAYFGDKLDFYVDGGSFSNNQSSTVIRIVDDAVEVLREGVIKIDEATGKIVS